MNTPLQQADKELLLQIARESITSRLQDRSPRYSDDVGNQMTEKCGVFVTLHIGSKLRGCIGTLHACEPLIDTVKDIARSSAFHDPRFSGVTKKELSSINIEISVLTPLKRLHSVDEIEIGKHGLYMSRGPNTGVLLPQVATEQCWGREEFLSFTCKKAGLPTDAWHDDDVEIYSFEASIFSESA